MKSMLRFSSLICASLLILGVARADWQDVQSVDSGAPILVRSGFVTDAGKYIRSTSDSLSVDTRNGQVIIAKDDIDEVIVFRTGRQRVRRALITGGIAAGVTAVVLFPMAANLSTPRFTLPSVSMVTNGAAIGVASYTSARTKRIYKKDR